MKFFFIMASSALLFGCALGSSSEIKSAEKMLEHFQCKNIEVHDMPQSNINTFHQQSLAVSKQKASTYIEQYKEGQTLFDMPLDEVVEQQYQLYKSACQSLGGVTSDF
ncbi:hypothetical protein IAE19_08300 [Acinetobacter sp. S40]|uniref:hypothetical protein n=1 Tax=unclassified Acinetobacter TaxID=196816 RepID=UPI00190D036E|nr:MULTISPECIES: hypothetical protein [unclassified Acinetobacter]MBJ9985443.1 hypothetical protein [Acinetobacter sp. S40]MBK0063793.1 hypothetical protein [Acinetobacter sp. S55]MBK0066918.1 hypothetical protein [Acinetobacter sp. S54]